MTNDYLDSVKKQFKFYKMLGDKTFAQLEDDKLFWQYNDESNSIATIVKHLRGNMLITLDRLSDVRWRKGAS